MGSKEGLSTKLTGLQIGVIDHEFSSASVLCQQFLFTNFPLGFHKNHVGAREVTSWSLQAIQQLLSMVQKSSRDHPLRRKWIGPFYQQKKKKRKSPSVSWADIYTLLLLLHHHFLFTLSYLLQVVLQFYLYLNGLISSWEIKLMNIKPKITSYWFCSLFFFLLVLPFHKLL